MNTNNRMTIMAALDDYRQSVRQKTIPLEERVEILIDIQNAIESIYEIEDSTIDNEVTLKL